MNNFTSDELKTISKALDFYKYEMNKTNNMDEYRAWKSARGKFTEHLDYYRGVFTWKDDKS